MVKPARENLRLTLQQIFETFGGSISLDTWTDDQKRLQYLSLTCHFMEETGKGLKLNDRLLCVRALDVEESKTGEYMLSEVKQILEEFSLMNAFHAKKIVFVTDRGPNLVCAFKDVYLTTFVKKAADLQLRFQYSNQFEKPLDT